MDFKAATDTLGLGAPELASELAKELCAPVSAQWVRQARLSPSSKGHRNPPEGWERVIARLARERIPELKKLSDLVSPETR